MPQNEKTFGSVLIIFSIVLFIVLAFIKTQVDKQSSLICQLYSESNKDMTECPVHGKNNPFLTNISWMMVAAFGVDFLILGVGVYLLFFYKPLLKELKKEFKEIDLSNLSGEEKTIYDIIKNKNGSSYQTDLIKETGFSKVKITRILDRLETKDILERKRRGMTNIIVLK